MIWLSSDLRFKWFWLSIDLRFNWFGCQLIWDSNDLVVNRCVLQMILVVCWFELQVMWLSIDLRFKWFGCQLIWDSSDLVVNRFEIQMSWLSIDLRFKWFGCQMIWGSSDLVVNWCVIQMSLSNEAFLRDFLQKRSFEDQKRSFSARLPSKLKLWSSKTKLFCETSFKIEAVKLKNEAFLRDFLQNWSCEPKKTKHFCETSFKIEALKLKNEAFLRDFLQKSNFETQKCKWLMQLRTLGVPNVMPCWTRTRITLPSVLPAVSGLSATTPCVTSFSPGLSGRACALKKKNLGCYSLNTLTTTAAASGGQPTFSFLLSMGPQLHLTSPSRLSSGWTPWQRQDTLRQLLLRPMQRWKGSTSKQQSFVRLRMCTSSLWSLRPLALGALRLPGCCSKWQEQLHCALVMTPALLRLTCFRRLASSSGGIVPGQRSAVELNCARELLADQANRVLQGSLRAAYDFPSVHGDLVDEKWEPVGLIRLRRTNGKSVVSNLKVPGSKPWGHPNEAIRWYELSSTFFFLGQAFPFSISAEFDQTSAEHFSENLTKRMSHRSVVKPPPRCDFT